MAANFEVTLFVNQLACYTKYISLFHCLNGDFILDEMLVIDNWEYENQRKLNLDVSHYEIVDLINNGKIIMAYGHLNEKHRCGFILHKVNSIYEITLWTSTKELPFLDSIISGDNEHIYRDITNHVVKELSDDLILCGIGSETSIHYSDAIADVMQSSHNVFEWISPKDAIIQMDIYVKSDLNNCHVWRLARPQ